MGVKRDHRDVAYLVGDPILISDSARSAVSGHVPQAGITGIVSRRSDQLTQPFQGLGMVFPTPWEFGRPVLASARVPFLNPFSAALDSTLLWAGETLRRLGMNFNRGPFGGHHAGLLFA